MLFGNIDTVVKYQADAKSPWVYSWVGFHGLKAESYLTQANLTIDKPIFRYDENDLLKDCLIRMINTKALTKSREIMLLGLLYEFLSLLVECADDNMDIVKDRKETYVKKSY
jgi:hypothetical protein